MKLNNIIRAAFLIVSAGIVWSVSSCMSKDKFSVKDCLKYMENRYGESFETDSLSDPSKISGSALGLFVTCDRFPGKKIRVNQYKNNEKGYTYRDNYVSYVYEDDVRKMAEKLASDAFGECKVIYEVNNRYILPEDYSPDMGFDKFVSSTDSYISLSILLPPDHGISQKDEDIRKIYELFKERKAVVILNLFYTKDMETYRAVETVSDTVVNRSSFEACGQFLMKDDLSVDEFNWR